MRRLALYCVAALAAACSDPLLHDTIQADPPSDTTCAPNATVRNLEAEAFDGWIRLSWTNPATDEEGVIVERREGTSADFLELDRLAADAVEFNDFIIDEDSRYGYRARTFRAGGAACVASASNDVVAYTYPLPPDQLSHASPEPTEVELHWVDVNEYETGYRVERRTQAGAFVKLFDAPPAPGKGQKYDYRDIGLDPLEPYVYRVTAINAAGEMPLEMTRRTSIDPQLQWTEDPWVDAQCTLVAPGTVSFDDASGTSYVRADASVTIGTTAPETAADEAGMVAQLTELPAGDFEISWSVTDNLGGTGTATRTLNLSRESTVRGLDRIPTLEVLDHPFAGRQGLRIGCADCSGPPGMLLAGDSATCALGADDTLKCWGEGSLTARGLNSEIYVPTPICEGGLGSTCTDVQTAVDIRLSRDGDHSCALLADGGLRCWGDNYYGALGDGTTISLGIPVDVCASGSGYDCERLLGVLDVAAGDGFTCALTWEGHVWCWGTNSYGTLGNGESTGYSTNPVRVCRGSTQAPPPPCEERPLENVIAISAGSDFVCALHGTGEVSCWGYNYYSQLGDGTGSSERDNPVSVCASGSWIDVTGNCFDAGAESPLTGAVAITTGARHACAVMDDGTARCWGYNYDGQLGTGDKVEQGTASDVCATGLLGADCVPLRNIAAIGAGLSHTCAIIDADPTVLDGEVVCWGAQTDGRLGNGISDSSIDVTNPTSVCRVGSEQACQPLTGIGHLSVGQSSNCTLDAYTHEALCWGANYSGALGTGNAASRKNPTPVCESGSARTCTPFADLATLEMGRSHACAITNDGRVHCWGNSSNGKLGLAQVSAQAFPLDGCLEGVGPECTRMREARAWSLSGLHACAVGLDGRVKCWGENGTGMLGNGCELGDSGDCWSESLPVTVCRAGRDETCVPLADVALVETGRAVEVATYEYASHTCAVDLQGRVWCWGSNEFGQLGIASIGTDSSNAVAVRCPAEVGASCGGNGQLNDALGLALGETHSCALFANGSVACWGGNGSGQLGTGTFIDAAVAQPVSISDVVALTAGASHTCALTLYGTVRCWGDNSLGQVGDGSTAANIVAPVEVCAAGTGANCTPLSGVVALASGANHTCAALGDGRVKCWGSNSRGQIGNGDAGSSVFVRSPVTVCAPSAVSDCSVVGCGAPLADAVGIIAGGSHSCALRENGRVSCWGRGEEGQLGDPTEPYWRCQPTLGTCLAGAVEYDPGNGEATPICDETSTFDNFQFQTCDRVVISVP